MKQVNKILLVPMFAFAVLLSSFVKGDSQIYYIHNDHLGTPQVVTDKDQNVVWSTAKTPFGELENESGSIEQPIRFPGQYADAETGYYYNYYRDYDPSLGRYIQSDPLGIMLDNFSPEMIVAESMGAVELPYDIDPGYLNHSYAYVDSNPLVYSDPDGLSALAIPGFCARNPALCAGAAAAAANSCGIDPNEVSSAAGAWYGPQLGFWAAASGMFKTGEGDAGRIKQGREKNQKKRKGKNWTDNGNSRTPKKEKKHTPGKGHGNKSRGKGK